MNHQFFKSIWDIFFGTFFQPPDCQPAKPMAWKQLETTNEQLMCTKTMLQKNGEKKQLETNHKFMKSMALVI